jgi:hypothetical protein
MPFWPRPTALDDSSSAVATSDACGDAPRRLPESDQRERAESEAEGRCVLKVEAGWRVMAD